MYIDLLKKCLLDSIYDSHLLGRNEVAKPEYILNGNYFPERAHTMVGMKRLNNIQDCFEDVIHNKVPGDLIETGVWRGGSSIFMAGLVKYYREKRKVFVADSFEGLPPPDDKYPQDKGGTLHQWKFLAVSLEEVKNNFKRYDLLDDNIIFVKGFFEYSLKDLEVDKLAILRLDGDMYSSTIQVLEQLYHKVSEGGYIIIDDYALKGCKKAVDDFRKANNITSEIKIVDWTGAYWKK